jgi:hypothetical protein
LICHLPFEFCSTFSHLLFNSIPLLITIHRIECFLPWAFIHTSFHRILFISFVLQILKSSHTFLHSFNPVNYLLLYKYLRFKVLSAPFVYFIGSVYDLIDLFLILLLLVLSEFIYQAFKIVWQFLIRIYHFCEFFPQGLLISCIWIWILEKIN